MELALELKTLVGEIIDLMRMDEQFKRDMKQDPDVYLASLLLQFKREMSDPKSHSLHRHYAFEAMLPRNLVKAQEIVGKNEPLRGTILQRLVGELSRPHELKLVTEKAEKYGSKKRKEA